MRRFFQFSTSLSVFMVQALQFLVQFLVRRAQGQYLRAEDTQSLLMLAAFAFDFHFERVDMRAIAPAEQNIVEFAFGATLLALRAQLLQFRDAPMAAG